MLRKETVESSTFALLKKLQAEDALHAVRLVGGTALSLLIGHRRSDDLDLFTTERFDTGILSQLLSSKFDFTPRVLTETSITGEIDCIKIDFIYHPFKWLKPPVEEEGIRVAAIDDIVAMKLHAIINSGMRPKDFVDVAYLNQWYSYDRMKALLLEKYPSYDPIMADRAITYFEDIDISLIPSIKIINGKFDFEKIKRHLLQMTDNPFKVYSI